MMWLVVMVVEKDILKYIYRKRAYHYTKGSSILINK